MRTPPRSSSSKGRDTTCTTERSVGPACRRVSDAGRRRDRGSGRSSRKAGPALGAAVLQNRATGAGRHPGAEAVALGSPVVVGLKCALHEILLGRSGVHAGPVAVACCKTLCSMCATGAHVRPGKAIGRRRARDNRPPTPQQQVARHVLAGRWIVLRSCACHATTSLSTPVDKRVDVRAESVSGVRPGETNRGRRRRSGVVTSGPGMEDVE